jgi:hypothetical protein
LTQPYSEIRVISEPVGACVVLDGWFVLEAPAAQRLRPGSHTVVVRAVGYEREELTIALKAEPALARAKLRRRMPPWNGEFSQ